MQQAPLTVPVLTTAQSGPLQLLEQTLLDKQDEIEAWFVQAWQTVEAPIYGSVDLRNAGFKLAPVDMNLFPAGFNNLNKDFLPLAAQATERALSAHLSKGANILLVPENHTRNQRYWENVDALKTIIEQAGFNVFLGLSLAEMTEPLEVTTPLGKTLVVYPIQRKGDHVFVEGCEPDMIWLNNDLSEGVPELLQSIAQPIYPPVEMGWHRRLKSVHFNQYQQVAEAFSRIVELDPWLFDPLFQYCGQVDFMKRSGEDCLARNVEHLLGQISKKYQQYNIQEDPFVIVKADAGTYGMGVMAVKSSEEVRALNRKQRTKMAASKGGQAVQRVIMQEGVHSMERWGEAKAVAEPVVYMIGQHVVGGFYRLHENKAADESLNAPGMQFEPLQFARPCHMPDKTLPSNDCPNRFYAYGVVARLSMLAAAKEKQEIVA